MMSPFFNNCLSKQRHPKTDVMVALKFTNLKPLFSTLLRSLLISTALLCWQNPLVFAIDVLYFNVQGLKLNMQLDDVIKTYQINTVKSSKDKFGIVNGYEIVNIKGELKLVLNFTGEKRLYRIDYTNQYAVYKNNSIGLLELLKKKYGDPTIENIETIEGISRDIRACWGDTCNRFMPATPALISTIEYASGKLKLTLVDNRIFNTDWQKYKDSYNDAKTGKNQVQTEPESAPSF